MSRNDDMRDDDINDAGVRKYFGIGANNIVVAGNRKQHIGRRRWAK